MVHVPLRDRREGTQLTSFVSYRCVHVPPAVEVVTVCVMMVAAMVRAMSLVPVTFLSPYLAAPA